MLRIALVLVCILLAGCADVDSVPVSGAEPPAALPTSPADAAPVVPKLANVTHISWGAPHGDVAVRLRLDLGGAQGCGFQATGQGVAEPGVSLVAFVDATTTHGQVASGLAPFVAVLDADSDSTLEDDTWGGGLGLPLASARLDLTVLARNTTAFNLTIGCDLPFDLLDAHSGDTLGLWNARSMEAIAAAGAPGAAVIIGGMEEIDLQGPYAQFVVHSMEAQIGQATLEGPFGVETWMLPDGRMRGFEGAGAYRLTMLASGAALGGWWAAGYTLDEPLF